MRCVPSNLIGIESSHESSFAHEVNFSKLSDAVEKNEVEFDSEEDNVDITGRDRNILEILKSNGDVINEQSIHDIQK